MLANAREIRDEYVRLRQVQRRLNTKLLRTVSKKGLEQSVHRDLGFWEGGKIVLDVEMDLGVRLRPLRVPGGPEQRRRAVRFTGGRPEGVRRAHRPRRHAPSASPSLRSKGSWPRWARWPSIASTGEPLLLADIGLSKTAAPGIVLATRVLPFSNFTMTSGAPVAIDPELATLCLDGLREAFERPGIIGLLPPKERKQLARNLIGLALEDPEEVKAAWRERVAAGARR